MNLCKIAQINQFFDLIRSATSMTFVKIFWIESLRACFANVRVDVMTRLADLWESRDLHVVLDVE